MYYMKLMNVGVPTGVYIIRTRGHYHPYYYIITVIARDIFAFI